MTRKQKNKRLKRLKIDFMKITELKEIRWGYLMDNRLNVYSEKYGYLKRVEPQWTQGRERVPLCDYNGNKHMVFKHILVAEAYVPNDDPFHKTEVHHKDGNKWNNEIDNLEWIDPLEHKHKHSIMRSNRRIVQKDTDGNIVKRFDTVGEARKYYGWNSNQPIVNCLKGKREYAYGSKWEYEYVN